MDKSAAPDELIHHSSEEESLTDVVRILEKYQRKGRQFLLSTITTAERLASVSARDRTHGVPNHELAKALFRQELHREPTDEEIEALLRLARPK